MGSYAPSSVNALVVPSPLSVEISVTFAPQLRGTLLNALVPRSERAYSGVIASCVLDSSRNT